MDMVIPGIKMRNVYGKWKVHEDMVKYETTMLCFGYIGTTQDSIW